MVIKFCTSSVQSFLKVLFRLKKGPKPNITYMYLISLVIVILSNFNGICLIYKLALNGFCSI